MKTRFTYKGRDCIVETSRYVDNDRLAIMLYDYETHEMIAKSTVNVPEEELNKDEVVIKNYSENEGMLVALRNAGIVEGVVREIRLGFVTTPVCKLNSKFIKEKM